jgi:hypothetical protein
MDVRPTPPSLQTSTQPFLHCCETWHVLAAAGDRIENRPQQPETWDAIAGMQRDLLGPLEERYGVVVLTYGFAGPALIKAIKKRADEGGWLPNIHPKGDQHAGYELNSWGNRICDRDGIAVDLRVPGTSSQEVADWVVDTLPFDRIYLYGPDRPFHMSWAPEASRVGQVVKMNPKKGGGLVPQVVVRGRKLE